MTKMTEWIEPHIKVFPSILISLVSLSKGQARVQIWLVRNLCAFIIMHRPIFHCVKLYLKFVNAVHICSCNAYVTKTLIFDLTIGETRSSCSNHKKNKVKAVDL